MRHTRNSESLRPKLQLLDLPKENIISKHIEKHGNRCRTLKVTGWLRGVQGEPTRAYCMYCEKTLHAHRLSLLKHTCTIRHQKAAQIHNIRKSKSDNSDTQEENKSILVNMNEEQIVGEHPETIIEFTEPSQIDDVEHEVEEIEDEEDEEPSFSIHFQKSRNQNSNAMSSTKPPISTHVLDTTKGIPVNGLQVSLYKLIEGRWTYINEGITSTDGRFASFLDRENFSTGRYKLHYDVDRFFESRKQDSLYPFIEIVIDCRSSSDHYHVPLLLSPYGYTTYRGS
ncbi:uncharacterized protein LOC108744194 isoform X2 [Agrilus planipennis]|uniref:hydroxyisourate hydrolase n=1 Tax=Agrilus planipennis TaxID=224129 RepID=A0A1W4XGV1_AGRPL|nr:uncharacterized protein LOC108744194 isoform X2 [Agrilus planipennis]